MFYGGFSCVGVYTVLLSRLRSLSMGLITLAVSSSLLEGLFLGIGFFDLVFRGLRVWGLSCLSVFLICRSLFAVMFVVARMHELRSSLHACFAF